jgi:hypothetical protein
VTNGWELGLILTVSDGVPFTPTWGTGSDPANTLSGDDFAFPNRLGGVGCSSLTNPGDPNNYIKTQCLVVPTAPDMAFWNANCDQFPPSLQPPMGPPVAATFPQCFNLRGNAGRNILIGPGITNLDFSVFKNTKIGEHVISQLRVEFFNLLNRANFQVPVNDISSPLFGQVLSTASPPRNIQLALKFSF